MNMTKFLIICLTIILSSNGFSATNERLKDLQTYYVHPKSGTIIPALQEVYSTDVVNASNIISSAMLFGRLIKVSGINPDDVLNAEKLDNLADEELIHHGLIFFYAEKEEQQAKIMEYAQGKVKERLQGLAKAFPPVDRLLPLLKDKDWPIVVTPYTWTTAADGFWSSFFVTGDTEYVNGVILLLEKHFSNAKGDAGLIEANKRVFVWSLGALASVHPSIKKYIESRLSEAGNEDLSKETRTLLALALVKATSPNGKIEVIKVK